MRKLLHTTPIIAFLLFSTMAYAQLNGLYTIGGTSSSYATFSAALTALSTSGVSGPVTFNARPGTYNEVITLDSVPGASATNRITFQSEDGNANDVTITAESYFSQGSYYNPIFVFNDAKYYTFNNLTVTYSTKYSYSYIYVFLVQLVYGSANDSINHCILNGLSDGSGVSDNYVIWDQSYNSNLVLNGCELNGGAYGYAAGYGAVPGPSIVNDTFTGQNYGGMYFYGCNDVLLQGNIINANQYSNTSFIGVEMDKCANANIVNNKLLSAYGTGFWFNNPSVGSGILASIGLVTNNYIESQYGIRGAGVDSFSIYNNTLRTTIQGITLTSGNGNVLLDNIFDNSGTGSSEVFNLSSVADFKESDYNDFYSTGLLAKISGTYSNLATWQTGTSFDVHSRSVLPPFVSGTDYHLTGCDSLKFGVPLGIAYDIDSDIRSTVSPVVGVYECPPSSVVAQFSASDTVICIGGAATFTDQSTDAPTSWHWTFTGGTPDTSSSKNPYVTYNTAGAFTVKLVAANANGTDSITKTGYIHVYALPVVGLINPNPDTICTGSSARLTLTGSTGNLLWQYSTDAINFSDLFPDTEDVYNTPPLIEITYYRVVVSSNLCGPFLSPMDTVFVIPAPLEGTISALPDTVCPGSAIRLSDTPAPGNSLQWQSSVTGDNYSDIAGANSAVYNIPSLTQSFDYRLIVSNGVCTDTSAPVTVTVNPAPVAPILTVSDSVICSNDSALIQTSGNYSSYLWNNNDTTPYIWTNTAGTFWVTVADANGCTAVSNQQDIYVYPTTGDYIIVEGDTLTSYGSISYQWYFNDTIILGATSPVYIARETGNYAIQVTDTNGCTTLTSNVYITVTGVPVIHINSLVSIYPDPVSNTLFVKWNNATVNVTDIYVYDVLGEMVLNKMTGDFYGSFLALDVSVLPGGMYFVVAKANNNAEYVKKVVKE